MPDEYMLILLENISILLTGSICLASLNAASIKRPLLRSWLRFKHVAKAYAKVKSAEGKRSSEWHILNLPRLPALSSLTSVHAPNYKAGVHSKESGGFCISRPGKTL